MCKGEADRRYAVGRVEDGGEHVPQVTVPPEQAEQGRLAVVRMELAVELGVGEDASPALADSGGAGEGGRQRRETEEDLPQKIVAVRNAGRARRRGASVATDAAGANLTGLDLGVQARAASACRYYAALLARLDLGIEVRAVAACRHSGELLARAHSGAAAQDKT